MIIYVESINERLLYTFDFIFKEQNIPYKLTNDLEYFLQSKERKLNYSSYPCDTPNHIEPAALLFDENIQKYTLSKSSFDDVECLSFNGVTDPFAAVFYVLTRYEEYLEFTADHHERFQANSSINSKMGWLKLLIVEHWTRQIITYLQRINSIDKGYQIQELKIIPTFDIDNTYAYKYKIGIRKLLSIAKDYSQKNTKRINERKEVLKGKIQDPYDTFSYIKSISDRGFEVILFWHLGDYAQFDKNLSALIPEHRKLIQEMGKSMEIGIHPSYASNGKVFTLENEKNRLQEILGRKVTLARQHFLKLKFPETYLNYQKVGIKKDFTLGYAQKTGFRSGTLRTHNWFNLMRNERSDLLLQPFSYMDGTLNEYEKLSIEEAKEEIHTLYKEAAQFGGNFVFLWHNETIGNYNKWKGWTDVLEFTLSLNTKEDE